MSRKFFSRAAAAACAITITLGFGSPTFANTLIVNKAGTATANCQASPYTEIQQAVIAAHYNDTIYVCAGTYVVPVNINKPLTIQGALGAVLQPTTAQMTANRALPSETIYPLLWFHDTYGEVTITNLTVDGTNYPNCAGSCQIVGILGQDTFGEVEYDAVRNINTSGGAGDGFGIFLQSGPGGPPGALTFVEVEGNSVHDYKSAGIIANECGTFVSISNNSVQGLGLAATVSQLGIQIGFSAQGNITQNVSSNNMSPGTPCTGTMTSANFASEQTPNTNSWNIQIANNVSSMSEEGVADVNDQVHIQNNVISNSFCVGIYVEDNGNTVQNNTIFHTDPTNPASTGIYVVAGDNNNVSNNTINEAIFGVASNSSSTVANNESIFNVIYPFAGTFKSYSLRPPPHTGRPCFRR